MNDRYMQRRIAWHTEGYIDTDIVRTVALKKALENMDPVSLKRLLNTSYGLTPAYNAIQTMMVLHELQTRNKEEKKMHKKQKVNGHVVHKLAKCENLYYTVESENGRIVVYMLKYDEGTGEPYYYEYGRMNICAKQLGHHGYLESQINWLIRRYSDTTSFKEEKKMNKKKYYSGSVAVETWRTRKAFKAFDDITLYQMTDVITFRDGRYIGAIHIPGGNIPTGLPIDKSKLYTKEEIAEAITTAWDKGEYAEEQTDISWIFNPDPEGVTGKLHIGGGEFSYGITRDELATGRGSIYYYIPENRDPTILEFKNGKYVRGDNDGGLTAFAPFNLWRSIFGDNRFYETWDDVKKAVVEAINNRKIYVNVPCIPELKEENCYIDD